MFTTNAHVIISSEFRNNPKIIIEYVKHQNQEVDMNVHMVFSTNNNKITFSLNPIAARYMAKQLLNVADEMENDM